jgi:hypothetical protein
MYHYYSFRRDEFLTHYHKRSNVESTFSMIKAKFRDYVRSKTDVAMTNEVLCKILCHNICCVIQSMYELGIEPTFWEVLLNSGIPRKRMARFGIWTPTPMRVSRAPDPSVGGQRDERPNRIIRSVAMASEKPLANIGCCAESVLAP